jgi:hypothetical protein
MYWRASVSWIFRGWAEVQQVCDRKEDRNRLDAAVFTLDRIAEYGRTWATTSSQQKAQVATGASTGNAQVARVDLIIACVMTHKSHGSVDVLGNLRHGRLRLGDMIDDDNGVAATQQRRSYPGPK